jgi:hypothetical protein
MSSDSERWGGTEDPLLRTVGGAEAPPYDTFVL